MKQIIILMAVVVTVACHKNNNTSPQSTQNTSTTGGNTNPTDTTSNDSTKVKIFYSLQLDRLKTSVSDYIHDTANVRIYHNTTQLRNHRVIADTSNPSVNTTLGLSLIENCDCNQGNTYPPVLANHGDSIVIVFDHLEYNGTAVPSANENFLHIFCKFYNQNKVLQAKVDAPFMRAFWAYTNCNTTIDPFIGYGVGQFTSYYWQLGGQYKLVYHIQ